MNEQRLIDLETKFAHQEDAIEKLQLEIFEQTKIIEELNKKLKLINDRLDSLAGGALTGPIDKRPPHY